MTNTDLKKVCTLCGRTLDATQFYKDKTKADGRRPRCKECEKGHYRETYAERKDAIQASNKESYRRNIDKRKAYSKAYYEKNSEEINAAGRERYSQNKETHKEKRKANAKNVREYQQRYKEKNKEVLKEKRKANQAYTSQYVRERRKDPLIRLKTNIRNLISNSFRRREFVKTEKTERILGIDVTSFVEHLVESFYIRYGRDVSPWDCVVHIDHIVPLATAKSEEDVLRLCHYTNLQLLKAEDNLSKNSRLDWEMVCPNT